MLRPIASLLTALSLLALGVFATGLAPALLPVACLAAVTPCLIQVDLREHRLPNHLTLAGVAAGLVDCATAWVVDGRVPLVPLLAALAFAGFLLLLNLAGGMGMGDVKLAAALGLASWNVPVAVLSPVFAFLTGGLVSLVLLVAGRRGRRIPFGPFLLGGFWTAVALVALSRL